MLESGPVVVSFCFPEVPSYAIKLLKNKNKKREKKEKENIVKGHYAKHMKITLQGGV